MSLRYHHNQQTAACGYGEFEGKVCHIELLDECVKDFPLSMSYDENVINKVFPVLLVVAIRKGIHRL